MSKPSQRAPTVFLKDTAPVKIESKQYRRRSIILEFCSNSSAHGLSGIARGQSTVVRVFWSISFAVFTAVMIIFVIKAILAYFDYPTDMDLSIISELPQYFPAVSICNVSPYRLDQFSGSSPNYTSFYNLSDSNDTKSYEFQVQDLQKVIVDYLNSNKSPEIFSFTLSPMLYTCTFNSVPCSTSSFILFLSSKYGNCYTFNAKLKNSTGRNILYANEYGGEGKLSLGLYIHKHQYVPYAQSGM